MDTLTPLNSLFDLDRGPDLPLPPLLVRLYGRLQLPRHQGRPAVIGNFVSTLDGVVALGGPGNTGGGEISGFNAHDRMVMGLLRAIADVVIVGAATQRAAPRHRWTAAYIAPAFADAYQALRTALGKSRPPLTVIVTASGTLDLSLPVFQSDEVPVLIVTTISGAQHLNEQRVPAGVEIVAVSRTGSLRARDILAAVSQHGGGDVILVEGGPLLMGDFFAERSLDELFLTLAPQVAGRDGSVERPGFVAGKRFAPEWPLWGTLISVKRAGSHLFLRYAFDVGEQASLG